MVIAMKDFGLSLCTRESGRAAFKEIESSFATEFNVIFDFAEVNSITNSFADEVFGRLVLQHGIDNVRNRTHFANINRSSALTIRTAIERRKKPACLSS